MLDPQWCRSCPEKTVVALLQCHPSQVVDAGVDKRTGGDQLASHSRQDGAARIEMRTDDQLASHPSQVGGAGKSMRTDGGQLASHPSQVGSVETEMRNGGAWLPSHPSQAEGSRLAQCPLICRGWSYLWHKCS